METNGLNKLFFDAINRVMVQTGHMMKGGTIVDATIINAPSSTKNTEKARDPVSYTHLSLIRITPKVGSPVQTPDGRGVVVEANLLTGMLKVAMDDAEEAVPVEYHRRDVKSLRNESGRSPRQEAETQPEDDAEEL